MSTAREVILGRIRAGLTTSDPAAETSAAVEALAPAAISEEITELFATRVADYRASVVRCHPTQAGPQIAAICERHSARRLVVPDGLPPEWRPPDLDYLIDAPPAIVSELDSVDGAITGSAVAVAVTGTVILDGSRSSGRRALSLIPDLHICVVHCDAVVATLPEAIARLEPAIRAGQPITLISGPSATSDIELSRVEGVHGPRRLEIVLLDAPA